nr:Ail/Lom family outer membrane beta-barrel protein [Escherichia coli]
MVQRVCDGGCAYSRVSTFSGDYLVTDNTGKSRCADRK